MHSAIVTVLTWSLSSWEKPAVKWSLRFGLVFLGPLIFSGTASGQAPDRLDLTDLRGVQEMVISVRFLDRTLAIYESVGDWRVLHRSRAPAAQASHWGLSEKIRIEQAVMGVAGQSHGLVRFIRFNGVDQVRIRSSARPFDTGGIFNINSSVKDLEATFEALRDNGFTGFGDPTYYTLNERRYGGAMLRGHDGVVINLITRVSGNYDDLPPFSKMSNVRNATQIVSDFDANMDFFENKMGWHKRWEASPSWPEDGSNNMGIPNSLLLDGTVSERAAGFQFDRKATGGRIEIFAFDGIAGEDFSSRARPPNLGILMYRVHVADLDGYTRRVANRGVRVVRPIHRLVVAPYGLVASAIVEAPSGAWIELFQQL